MRWLRRGHTYKPNAIVRGCYAIADWLGDFAPMMSSAKQGVINTGLIIANFIILVGILITSAVHSLALLRYAGATGGLEYIMLLVWESVFLVSSFLVDQAVLRGMKLKKSWQVWVPFLIGLVFVFFSNFLGMASNLAGMLIGGVTPLLLLFIKWMLGWQLSVRAQHDDEKRQEKMINTYEKIAKQETTSTIENVDENNVAETTEKVDENDQEKLENIDRQNSEKVEKNFGESEDQSAVQNFGDEHGTKPVESSGSMTKISGEKAIKSTENQTEKIAKQNKGRTKKKTTKKTKRSRKKDPQKRIEKAVEIIKKSLEETGEYPTHKEVAVLAKTSEYYAKKARSIVKEEQEERIAS